MTVAAPSPSVSRRPRAWTTQRATRPVGATRKSSHRFRQRGVTHLTGTLRAEASPSDRQTAANVARHEEAGRDFHDRLVQPPSWSSDGMRRTRHVYRQSYSPRRRVASDLSSDHATCGSFHNTSRSVSWGSTRHGIVASAMTEGSDGTGASAYRSVSSSSATGGRSAGTPKPEANAEFKATES